MHNAFTYTQAHIDARIFETFILLNNTEICDNTCQALTSDHIMSNVDMMHTSSDAASDAAVLCNLDMILNAICTTSNWEGSHVPCPNHIWTSAADLDRSVLVTISGKLRAECLSSR